MAPEALEPDWPPNAAETALDARPSSTPRKAVAPTWTVAELSLFWICETTDIASLMGTAKPAA